mmetsp:Transcript_25780/g.65538  ORF Transcript_25780/g.65538 Transcript_25780/m.65538 type:complete len:297 (-) Transcript_25780:294-1184(-)
MGGLAFDCLCNAFHSRMRSYDAGTGLSRSQGRPQVHVLAHSSRWSHDRLLVFSRLCSAGICSRDVRRITSGLPALALCSGLPATRAVRRRQAPTDARLVCRCSLYAWRCRPRARRRWRCSGGEPESRRCAWPAPANLLWHRFLAVRACDDTPSPRDCYRHRRPTVQPFLGDAGGAHGLAARCGPCALDGLDAFIGRWRTRSTVELSADHRRGATGARSDARNHRVDRCRHYRRLRTGGVSGSRRALLVGGDSRLRDRTALGRRLCVPHSWRGDGAAVYDGRRAHGHRLPCVWRSRG